MKDKKVWFIFFVFFMPSIFCGQENPSFYAYQFARFQNISANWPYDRQYQVFNTNIDDLIQKYGDVLGKDGKKWFKGELKIPIGEVEKNIVPKPKEKLWVFLNSKLIGITHPKKYFIDALGDGSTLEVVFKIDESFKNNKRESINMSQAIFVSVPTNFDKKDLPTESKSISSTKKEVQKFLNKKSNASDVKIEQIFCVKNQNYVVIKSSTDGGEKLEIYEIGKKGLIPIPGASFLGMAYAYD